MSEQISTPFNYYEEMHIKAVQNNKVLEDMVVRTTVNDQVQETEFENRVTGEKNKKSLHDWFQRAKQNKLLSEPPQTYTLIPRQHSQQHPRSTPTLAGSVPRRQSTQTNQPRLLTSAAPRVPSTAAATSYLQTLQPPSVNQPAFNLTVPTPNPKPKTSTIQKSPQKVVQQAAARPPTRAAVLPIQKTLLPQRAGSKQQTSNAKSAGGRASAPIATPFEEVLQPEPQEAPLEEFEEDVQPDPQEAPLEEFEEDLQPEPQEFEEPEPEMTPFEETNGTPRDDAEYNENQDDGSGNGFDDANETTEYAEQEMPEQGGGDGFQIGDGENNEGGYGDGEGDDPQFDDDGNNFNENENDVRPEDSSEGESGE